MIAVDQALGLIKQNHFTAKEEYIPLDQLNGRILAEPIFADRDFPPFDRVTMDGIAINYDSYQAGNRKFKVEHTQAAGQPKKTLSNPDYCIEIMTGAIRPDGTDTIVRYEDLNIQNGFATIENETIIRGKNIHYQGEDVKADTAIVTPLKKINAGIIAIAASVGKTELLVKKSPRVAIISTGDELVDIDQNPLPHQIRKSNTVMLQSILKTVGVDAALHHLPDDKIIMNKSIAKILDNNELVILSGGVSKGKFDFVPEILENSGVHKRFHKIKQRPGKPLWFGSTTKTAVFGLPGNPVSAFMGCYKYVMYWLSLHLGQQLLNTGCAKLKEYIHFKPELEYFLAVNLEYESNGEVYASVTPSNGSGDFIHLKGAEAILQLPMDKQDFKAGESYPFILLK